MELSSTKNAVDLALEKQRQESEARSILQDLERLVTTPVERKRRWVWELIQNAKDCALPKSTGNKQVNISFKVQQNRMSFTHDGAPFNLEDLLAIVRRTSTKSYSNADGNTGKFGTGFVTTHVLNRKVDLNGVLKNDKGLREFAICIDRTPFSLEKLQEELSSAFSTINKFYESSPVEFKELPLTNYSYELDEETLQLATDSLEELRLNLSFTLLINPSIHSLSIENSIAATKHVYSLSTRIEISQGLYFSELLDDNKASASDKFGLLHFSTGKLVIGVPAFFYDSKLTIAPIGKQSRLFRDLPLVGTENWRVPVFLQSGEFLPSEPRDGVRTIRENEAKEDNTADANRQVLIQYRQASIELFTRLKNESVKNLFLLTETGLPIEKTEYTSVPWYTEEVQVPLRKFFLQFPLLESAAGETIMINKAKIPSYFIDDEINESFYSLAVCFYKNQFPNQESFKDWQRIILQEPQTWGDGILCTIDELVQSLAKPGANSQLNLREDETFVDWLNRLIEFLNKIGRSDLAEGYSIFLNQEGTLKRKQELRVDPGLNDSIKSIGQRLGQPVYKMLLDKSIIRTEGIDTFNIKGFFNDINTSIGGLVPSGGTREEFKAVFELVSMFSDRHAHERERWYSLVRQLPNLVSEKVFVNDMDDFKWTSAELASVKYVSWLIEREGKFESFSEKYFQKQDSTAYQWLDNFYEILFRNQDYQELIRKYAVIPVQDGTFRKLEPGIYREHKPFPEIFKRLYTDYAGKGNCQTFLVASSISNENLPSKESDILSKSIDELFLSSDIEKKIEPGGPLNSLFHSLNEWFGVNQNDGDMLFPHFSRQRPMLYIKAFGPEVSKIVIAIHRLKKPIAEIEALVNLKMSAAELEQLILASQLAGGTQKLMDAAIEIKQKADEAAWRKKTGDAAEAAFKDAVSDFEAFSIENPDLGYDFEISVPQRVNKFLLEIKSTVQGKENIKMSSLQGRTAKEFPESYALCVLSRQESDMDVTKEYFIEHARFLTTVGTLVAPKVLGIEEDLISIRAHRIGDEASSALDDERYSVFVGKKAWDKGISFSEFIDHLKIFFELT